MPHITVLRKEISELIAAGEVIERPSSVIKEVVENAIDAGAKHITVEIQHGGTTYMRIVDDGCGMAPEEVPTAFLRHATSKIAEKTDLDHIFTLGFRGEALASIAAVAKVTVLTKRKEDDFGTSYSISGSTAGELEQTGRDNTFDPRPVLQCSGSEKIHETRCDRSKRRQPDRSENRIVTPRNRISHDTG